MMTTLKHAKVVEVSNLDANFGDFKLFFVMVKVNSLDRNCGGYLMHFFTLAEMDNTLLLEYKIDRNGLLYATFRKG